LDFENRLPVEATSHQMMRSSGTLHVKHALHSSALFAPMKFSHAPAKSNSYMGLAMAAVSGSLLSTVSPETGLRTRPLLLMALFLGAVKKRLPVRELSVASMIEVKRPMTIGREKKVIRSADASGPLKHVSSTHSSWSFQPLGLK